jgi:hypothetical protein
MRPLGIVLRGRFLFVTTFKTKIGFLIEVFSKHVKSNDALGLIAVVGRYFRKFYYKFTWPSAYDLLIRQGHLPCSHPPPVSGAFLFCGNSIFVEKLYIL